MHSQSTSGHGGGRGFRVKVSLQRRCPRCHSRSVIKLYGHLYQCGICLAEFTGLRVWPLRIGWATARSPQPVRARPS